MTSTQQVSSTETPSAEGGTKARDDIQVISRVAALLDYLSPTSLTIDAQQAAAVLGVGRSTAHRYLLSMERSGLLQRRDGSAFHLGPALVRLGTLALGGLGVVESSGPILHELATTIRGTIVLSVWSGQAPVVARVVPDRSRLTTVSIEVGRLLDPEAAQSLVFAAYQGSAAVSDALLERTIHPGETAYVARQVYAQGALKALAVPVFDRDGHIIATIAALGFSITLPDEEDDLVIDRLLDGAQRLQRL
jgi:DNA-binding IclR family transcriptional regulator